MKKTLAIILAVMMMAVCLVACGGGATADSPEAAVKNFINAINSGNTDAFINSLDPDSQSEMKEAFDQLKSLGINMSLKDILSMTGIEMNFSNVKFGNVDIDGDNALVETTIMVDGEESTSEIPCVKVNGKWYVDMSSAF